MNRCKQKIAYAIARRNFKKWAKESEHANGYFDTDDLLERRHRKLKKLYKTLNIIAIIAFILSVCCIDSDTIIPAIIAAISLLWLFPVAIRGCMNGEFEEN